MKSILFSLMIVVLVGAASGCGSGDPVKPVSPGPVVQPAQKAQPQAPSQSVIPTGERVSSGEFFMAVRLTDERQNIELIEARSLLPNSSVYDDDVYRASSPIFLGTVVPDKIEISFPLPPEVESASDDTVEVHYGCGSKRSPDIYPIKAVISNLNFDIIEGMPRGIVTSAKLRPLFHLCGEKAVSVVVEFRGQAGAVQAWEQIYLESGMTDEAP